MPRSRINDPANLPAAPNPTTDPAREKELVDEFQKRLQYSMQHYRMARKLFGDDVAFNSDLERLKRAVVRKRRRRGKQSRLHPEIELVITHHARRLAMEEGVEVNETHSRKAAVLASELLKPRGGRPDDPILEQHVTGLVALIQEFCGLPVLARRYRNSIYDPHFAEGISRIVPMEFEDLSAGITEARLVRMVERIRAKYAGEELRFLDLFPGYGAIVGANGVHLRRGLRLEIFEPNTPIFCH